MLNNQEKIYAEALYKSLEDTPGKENKIIGKFLHILKEKNLLHKTNKIIKEFIKIYNKANNITELTIESAFPLQQDIVAKISQAMGIEKYELKTKIDPELLGGFKAQYDDNLIDMSIKNQLKKLRSQLSN